MDDPQGVWTSMAGFLRSLPATLPRRPTAILIVSGHWETRGFAVTGGERPELVFDYYGFPPHTYQLRYDAPGAPDLATASVEWLLSVSLWPVPVPDEVMSIASPFSALARSSASLMFPLPSAIAK